MHNFDLSLDRITKVEGSASLEVRVKNNKVEHVHLKITEFKRFFTQSIEVKPIITAPQLLARICGTCSNAHLLCSIEACERALGIKPTAQTILLRLLTIYGLMIRDHALHLYLFVMPDIYNKDAFLDFDENDPEQHQLLHDAFAIKAAGNQLATIIAGRSIHAIHPTIGGFLHFPKQEEINKTIKQLQETRPAVLRLIKIFADLPWRFDRKTDYLAIVPERFGFLNGPIRTSYGETIPEEKFRDLLEHVVLPYSQASAYKHKERPYLVGALARLNLAKDKLHHKTQRDAADYLKLFPSTNIYHNNLAQAIEILHSIDDALEILTTTKFKPESLIKGSYKANVGVGVIEAPRGTLYHKIEIDDEGKIIKGEVIVPTGQNQVNMEEDIWKLVDELLPTHTKEEIVKEIEKLIRAYDPCMSCAAHFLKVNWQ